MERPCRSRWGGWPIPRNCGGVSNQVGQRRDGPPEGTARDRALARSTGSQKDMGKGLAREVQPGTRAYFPQGQLSTVPLNKELSCSSRLKTSETSTTTWGSRSGNQHGFLVPTPTCRNDWVIEALIVRRTGHFEISVKSVLNNHRIFITRELKSRELQLLLSRCREQTLWRTNQMGNRGQRMLLYGSAQDPSHQISTHLRIKYPQNNTQETVCGGSQMRE